MAYSLDNFVRSTLQADITSTTTTITVAKAAAPLRDPPDASASEPGVLVLQDKPASPTQIEIVTYTGRSIAGNVVTLTGCARGQEGSTASVWSSGAPTLAGLTAGIIADLQASVDSKLDKSGTAASATKLETARTIALGGLLGGSATFDGSGDVTITATMADNALSIAKVSGLQSALDAKVASATKGQAGGVAPLDGTGHVASSYLPQSVLGALNWQDTWDASTGNSPSANPQKGWYYTVNVAGDTDLDGITDWGVGDWAVYNGTTWVKVDNTDHIISVAGLSGTITSAALKAALAIDNVDNDSLAAKADKSSLGTMASQDASDVDITGGTAALASVSVAGIVTAGAKAALYTNANTNAFLFQSDNPTLGFMASFTGRLGVRDTAASKWLIVTDSTGTTCDGPFSAPSVTDTSDATVKTNVRRDPQRYRGIRKAVEMVLYDRLDMESDDEPGVLAQEVQRAGCHADDFVKRNASTGKLTVHYGKLALACALDPEPVADVNNATDAS